MSDAEAASGRNLVAATMVAPLRVMLRNSLLVFIFISGCRYQYWEIESQQDGCRQSDPLPFQIFWIAVVRIIMVTPIPFNQLSIPSFKVSGCGAEGCFVLNLNNVLLALFFRPILRTGSPNSVHSIRSGLKNLIGAFSLRHALDLSS